MFLFNFKNKKRKKGFTLLEVLLAVALVGIFSSFSLVVYRSFQIRGDMDAAQSAIVHSLRRAQILSQSVDDDTNWGVDIRSGAITLFKGTSYASRDSLYDESFDVPSVITFSGISEIVFSKLNGIPSTTGTITLTSVFGDSLSVTINSRGMVGY